MVLSRNGIRIKYLLLEIYALKNWSLSLTVFDTVQIIFAGKNTHDKKY
jgi:hypothetical protein